MPQVFSTLLLGLVASAAAIHDPDFEMYKAKFNKNYPTIQAEQHAREAFHLSMERLELRRISLGKDAEVFGLTKFSDMTEEDFKVFLGARPPPPGSWPDVESELAANAVPAKTVDWRNGNNPTKKPAVTTVKDQGQCGSCWAFSTAETIESSWMLAGNPMYDFSPQQIASCTTTCDGCGGGWPFDAYEQVMKNTGLSSGWFTPYVQSMYEGCMDASCTEKCSIQSQLPYAKSFPFAEITGYKYATPGCTGACTDQNIDLLKSSLATKGPTSVCVNAGAWQDYTGGILTQAACGSFAYTSIDHCVQLVASYEAEDSETGQAYFVIRNSWDADWGMNGYIQVEAANTCGLADIATHPTITAKQVKPNAYFPKLDATVVEFVGAFEETAAATTHYEDPNTTGSCQSGEVDVQIQGVQGKMCSPKCAFLTHKCPTDVPAGVTAKPTCALQGEGGKYCALICSPSTDERSLRAGDSQCGTNASCKAISGTGICTYDK